MPCQVAGSDEGCTEPPYWRAVYTTVPGCTWPDKEFCAEHGVAVVAGWCPPYNLGGMCSDHETVTDGGPHPIQLRALERVT